ncbi:uncharacterized protein CLUP02_06790 [Colletotrichum lupini]|uniref:Uncharacterized protein n=1 Tax=Colletotrichum lupini TaxID=145971 RepID=A0A9Q8SPS3_9PEZI|nr:uncharacterized protein CLUP02_06790 [Colletotrichum lupini]UQC81304.1 hypothetical protein CLUP02_06790 [Colletotrichum lupini]
MTESSLAIELLVVIPMSHFLAVLSSGAVARDLKYLGHGAYSGNFLTPGLTYRFENERQEVLRRCQEIPLSHYKARFFYVFLPQGFEPEGKLYVYCVSSVWSV